MKDLELFREKVFEVRNQKVMLDRDVAAALGTGTRDINLNADRSKKWDFLRESGREDMYRFQLTRSELDSMFQRETFNDFIKLPWAYTELGCAFFGTSMITPRACELAVQLSRAFVAVQMVARGEIPYLDQVKARVALHGEGVALLEMEKKAALVLGNTESLANAHAVQAVTREIPEITFKHLLTQNVSNVQDSLLTPTELGKRMMPSISNQKINKLLEAKGLQQRVGRTWEPTLMADGLYQWVDSGKKHSDGQPIRSVKWYGNKTLKELNG